MRDRVEEPLDLDVVVDPDASQAPLGILVVLLGQRPHRGALDRIEQLPAAHPEAAHLAAVHPLQSRGDRRVALSQGEERDVAQPAQDVRLREPHAGLHGRLVAGPARPRRQDAHVVVRRHHRVAAVHLGVVERRLVDAALEVVGHQQARRGSEEPEHPHVGLDPIRQRLRPARLRVGQARGPSAAIPRALRAEPWAAPPSTATKISAIRTSPVSGSAIGTRLPE